MNVLQRLLSLTEEILSVIKEYNIFIINVFKVSHMRILFVWMAIEGRPYMMIRCGETFEC
jgi:hypothetical protein